MNPNQVPVGNQEQQRFFTTKALAAKFSFSFTRKQLVILMNALNPIQLPLGDLRTEVLTEIRKEINNVAFNSVTENDLLNPENPSTPPLAPTPPVQTN